MQETVGKLSILLASALSEPKVKWALVQLISELAKDPDVIASIEELTVTIIQKKQVSDVTNQLLLNSTQEVLVDKEVCVSYFI